MLSGRKDPIHIPYDKRADLLCSSSSAGTPSTSNHLNCSWGNLSHETPIAVSPLFSLCRNGVAGNKLVRAVSEIINSNVLALYILCGHSSVPLCFVCAGYPKKSLETLPFKGWTASRALSGGTAMSTSSRICT